MIGGMSTVGNYSGLLWLGQSGAAGDKQKCPPIPEPKYVSGLFGGPLEQSAQRIDVGFYSATKLKRYDGTLASDAVIGIEFYRNGKVRRGRLGADASVNGIAFKAGTVLSFYEDGSLSHAQYFDVVTVKNRTFAGYDGRASLSFYQNGKVEKGTLEKNTRIGRFVYKADTLIQFHENGRVSSGTLAANYKINGTVYKAGDDVSFDKNGQLAHAQGSATVKIKGLTYNKSHIIEFHVNGQVAKGKLAAPARIGGTTYPAETYVYFEPGGWLISAIFFAKTTVRGIEMKVKDDISDNHVEVKFFPNGRLSEANFSVDTTVNGLVFRPRDPVRFYPNGRVMMGRLAEDATIKGENCGAGSYVYFKRNGSVDQCR